MKIKIKKLTVNAFIPTKANKGAAAYDVYTPESIIVKTGRQIIPLDFAIEIPHGYEAKIEPRSGYSSKGMEGLLSITEKRRFDCDVIQGKIDSDYRGCVGVIVKNNDVPFMLERGQRIAQLTIYKVEDSEFKEVKELAKTERGDGGFGSTNR